MNIEIDEFKCKVRNKEKIRLKKQDKFCVIEICKI